MTEKLVDINGTTVSITGEGRPVVLVHGVFMDRRMWFPQVEVLSRDYTVCCMDMLGHGYAPDPDGGAQREIAGLSVRFNWSYRRRGKE